MAIETGLPPRYEIRRLEPKHLGWTCAIIAYSMIYHSPLWKVIYSEKQAQRVNKVYKSMMDCVGHPLASGYSLGVFDKEYQFKRGESAAAGGKLYWDEGKDETDRDRLLEQMDFPLVSVALAYDSFNEMDLTQVQGLMEALPVFNLVFSMINSSDKRDEASWKAQGPGEVLFRAGTNTLQGHENKGLMKAAAHCMMREAAEKGFRAIQIDVLSDAVGHVWTSPPAPFSSEVVGEWQTWDCEAEGDDGQKAYPLRPARQKGVRVYCTLK